MRSATQYMIREHETLQAMLIVFKKILSLQKEGKTIPLEHLNAVVDFFRIYGDQIHHAKEEQILIPALLGHGFPMVGGPMCTFFKSLQMMREDLPSRIREVEVKLGGIRLPISGEDKESLYPGIHDGNIPIIDEHKFGRKLIAALQYCLNDPERIAQKGPGTFTDFAYDFVFLLEEHIDKENRCLFPMTDDTLTEAEQEKMLQDFKRADQIFFSSPDYALKENQWEELRRVYG